MDEKEKVVVNEKILNINNDALEALLKEVSANKTQKNVSDLLDAFKTARVLAPATIDKNTPKAVMEKMARKQPLTKEEQPRLIPITLTNSNGQKFIPIFTSPAKLPKDQKFQVVINMDMKEVLRVGMDEKMALEGVIVNHGSEQIILHQPFLETLKKVIEGKITRQPIADANGQVPPKREIRMNQEEFEIFARKNTERVVIPREAFSKKKQFMDTLEANPDYYMHALYAKLYGDKIPCPYQPQDFEGMVLNVDDETEIASIDTPQPNRVPGTAVQIIIVFNPKTEQIWYYLVELGEEDNVLCRVNEKGQHEELQTAEASGNMFTVLELVREERAAQAENAEA